MSDIETREESHALQAAADLIADEYRDDTRGGTVTLEMRWMIRKAWIAGRDWARRQQLAETPRLTLRDVYGPIADHLERP